MNTLEMELREFIIDNFLFGHEDGLLPHNDTSFIEVGILDSTGALELVQHVESRYGIRIQDEEFAPEYLDSINRLAQFIRRKRVEKESLAGTTVR
jgi:acyl carrier protein